MNEMVEYLQGQLADATSKIDGARVAYEEAGQALKDQLPRLLNDQDFTEIDRLTWEARNASTELQAAERAAENMRGALSEIRKS